MATVRLDELTKVFGGLLPPAVDRVNLSVEDGEFMVLLGPSGCGKSTTLRMIAGLETITSGVVAVDGKVVNDVPARDRDMAMVFQSYALYPHMSVEDNLSFGLRRRKLPKTEIERRVGDAARALGLRELFDRKPGALSGGQRQRVALGRAIVREPKVFLFDEPLSNLDAALRMATRYELAKLHHRLGATMIYVTHDQVEAMTLGTRICVMNRGQVVQTGAPMDVYNRPADAFVARFLGSPPMNMFKVRLAAAGDGFAAMLDGGRLVLDRWRAETLAPYRDRDMLLGVRPEDLATSEGGADGGVLRGKVVAVEPLGAETLVIAEVAGVSEDVTARLPREAKAVVGQAVGFHFPRSAPHLFDPNTSKAIAPDRVP